MNKHFCPIVEGNRQKPVKHKMRCLVTVRQFSLCGHSAALTASHVLLDPDGSDETARCSSRPWDGTDQCCFGWQEGILKWKGLHNGFPFGSLDWHQKWVIYLTLKGELIRTWGGWPGKCLSQRRSDELAMSGGEPLFFRGLSGSLGGHVTRSWLSLDSSPVAFLTPFFFCLIDFSSEGLRFLEASVVFFLFYLKHQCSYVVPQPVVR